MNPRLLTAALFLIAACLALVLLPMGPAPVPVSGAEIETHAPAVEQEPAAAVEIDDEVVRREVEGVEAPSNNPMESRGTAVIDPARAATVVVRLVTSDGMPYPAKDMMVEAQSWIDATDEVFTHEAPADVTGVATFVFPDEVHIDWVKFTPGPTTGLAFGYAEQHHNVSAGETWEQTLVLSPGGSLYGRVLAADGQPRAGVKLNAYGDWGDWGSFEDFDPGVGVTTTDPTGYFEFANLPVGTWGIAAVPDEYMQLSPSLWDEESRYFEVSAGDRQDVGVIRVDEMSRFALTVVDKEGKPMPRMRVSMFPIRFAAPFLQKVEGDDELAQLIGERGSAQRASSTGIIPWPYGDFGWITDDKGKAEMYGVPGTWELWVRPDLVRESDGYGYRTTITMPSSDQTVQIDLDLAAYSGRVVDTEGEPVRRASVQFRRKSQAGTSTRTVRSAADGSFSVDGLPLTGDYTLRIDHNDFVRAEFPIDVERDKSGRFALMRGHRLTIKGVDTAGKSIGRQRFRLTGGIVSGDVNFSSEELRQYLESTVGRNQSRRSNSSGVVTFSKLLPGNYEIALVMPMSMEYDSRGRLRTGYDVYQSWRFIVPDETQQVVIDMSAYQKPTRPEPAKHVGRVLDAETGQPVPGAHMRFRSGGTTRYAATNSNGEFRHDVAPGPTSVRIMKEGYLVNEVASVVYEPGEHRHEFLLEPGGRDVQLTIVDRDGVQVSDIDITCRDAGGAVYALGYDEDGDRRWSSRNRVINGVLDLKSVRPGPLDLSVSMMGYVVTKKQFEVLPGTGVQSETVFLDMSTAEMRTRLAEQLQLESDIGIRELKVLSELGYVQGNLRAVESGRILTGVRPPVEIPEPRQPR